MFPLEVEINDTTALKKVWVNYLSQFNVFHIKVNDIDFYKLVKEEVDYDPTRTELLSVKFEVNDTKVISGSTPWYIEDIEDKIQCHLDSLQQQAAKDPKSQKSLKIVDLKNKCFVANEFFDHLCGYQFFNDGLDKLILGEFSNMIEPLENEV